MNGYRHVIVGLWLVASHAANAQTGQEIAVPLSDPSRPVVLEVSAIRGSVTVRGHDGEQVLIDPLNGPQRIEPVILDEPIDSQGLRRIRNNSMGLSAEEFDNTVTVRMDSGGDDTGITISVPRRTSVRASTFRDGSVTVEGVTGEHELSNVNGSITATNISGSVVVNTTNGDVTVSLLELTPDKAMSFSTWIPFTLG